LILKSALPVKKMRKNQISLKNKNAKKPEPNHLCYYRPFIFVILFARQSQKMSKLLNNFATVNHLTRKILLFFTIAVTFITSSRPPPFTKCLLKTKIALNAKNSKPENLKKTDLL